MENGIVIAAKEYLYSKYNSERYEFKNVYTIADAFCDKDNTLYVIEFIDTKMKRTKTLELLIPQRELFRIK